MEFILTKHSKFRMYQRTIQDPNTVPDLKLAKSRIKKEIKRKCKQNGFNKDLVYYRTNQNPIAVYVCEIIGIGKYKVITAFRLYN